ncbi:PREDICTED: uncharacterized protein LOC106744349 [Dinoponera quadriceps]|uniref:Endosome-associated-trafficking regulator 1 n=1 Tax=Dinoponera quadriceps TaxID=609295 RepID=A0A6P3X8D5_DINQU|nr:PREDICTED: uncharacterized protein LOC106744349 [Dinoponera quadriceps]
MAHRKKTTSNDESCHRSSSLRKNTKHHVSDAEVVFSSSSSSDEEVAAVCRGGRRNSSPSDRFVVRNRVEQPTGQENRERRESNPFSFKVFLKNGTANYHNTGARPKVYYTPASSPGSHEAKETGVYSSRNPTELPDFVQDHLVIEQCYLNHAEPATQQVLLDMDNLPDFALNSMEQSRLRNEKRDDSNVLCDLPFDLTGMLDKSLPRDHSASMHSNHLDLPTFERCPIGTPVHRPEPTDFPFDLPLPNESIPNVDATTRDGETSVHKSLPDFLSDGPIHNRTTDSEPNPSMAESTERRLLLENERLRHELDAARRQISEKTDRIRSLEVELLSRKEIEHEETAHLEKAMEQVEDNLKQSTKRAVNAESTVTSLKKEIKALTTEISFLRLENSELRAGIAAAGQSESNATAANMNRTVRRLARDLFAAASSAEVSLRQLMSGVDNLRVLASTLENVDRIEDWTKDFLPDFEEDNATGPPV